MKSPEWLALCKGSSRVFLVCYRSYSGLCEVTLLNVCEFPLILHNSSSCTHLQNLSLIPILNSGRNPHPICALWFVQSDFWLRWLWLSPPKLRERSGFQRWVTLWFFATQVTSRCIFVFHFCNLGLASRFWTCLSPEGLKFESPSKWKSYEGFDLEHREACIRDSFAESPLGALVAT